MTKAEQEIERLATTYRQETGRSSPMLESLLCAAMRYGMQMAVTEVEVMSCGCAQCIERRMREELGE
jgi:hypothetical protein